MFEVSQKVWCAMFGEGEVTEILTADTKFTVVVRFGGIQEFYTLDGKYQSYAVQTLFPYPVEIVKKVTKPSINWEHVRGKYKFLAQDSTGNAWLYSEEPVSDDGCWVEEGDDYAEANSYASYTPGTCDWKESLVARPKDA